MATESSHADLAEALRRRLVESGVIDPDLRRDAMRAGAGEHLDRADAARDLARAVGTASYRVTNDEVADVRQRLGSDVAAFEVVMSASVGAGLHRWDLALRAIREATDATG